MDVKNNIPVAIIFLTTISLIDGALPEKNRHVDDDSEPVTLTNNSSRVYSDDTYFNGNEWYARVVNDGQWATYKPPGGSGGLWPRGSNNSVIFNAGLWIGFTDDVGSYRMAGVLYGSDFRPGPYGSFDSESNDDYRVYKVNRWDDATDIDWAEWPVDLGAPWEDNNSNGTYDPAVDNPYLPLDQTLFTVYSDSGDHNEFGGSPIGAEVRQTIFGGASSAHDDLARTFFVKYEIINSDTFTWNNPLFGIWSDPDLGNYRDDLVGVDVDSNMIYVYNSNEQDDVFPIPPAVGFKYISGLNSLHDDLYAAGAIYGGEDSNDPDNEDEAYNRMLGLQNNGTSITDPNTGQDTTFMMYGDPVAGTGWVDDNVRDKRIFMSVSANLSPGETTPVVAPGDTVGFVIAVIIAQGTDRLNSITELRDASYAAKSLWYNNFAGVTLVDRPILESDEDYGLFSNISLDNVGPEGTTQINRTYYNTGNDALNISMSINDNNYSISPSTATISAGGSGSFSFSYTADNFTYSAMNVPSEYGTIQSAVDAALVTNFSEDINLTIDDPYSTPTFITDYGYGGSGDTVYVSPGMYTENLVIDGKSIYLIATDSDPASTIIDGNNDGHVIKIDLGGGLFTLNGFTIQNANTQDFPWTENFGAGLMVYDEGTVNITNNIFKDNHAGYGGVYYAEHANGTINRNLFIGNTATNRANVAYLRGVPDGGIGINFYNNTIWDTSESTSIIRINNPEHRVINNIIWRVSDQNLEDIDDITSEATVEYNIVKNGYDGTGNISDDPQFYDPDNGDFRLGVSSPAIDAGDPDLDQDGVTWESDTDDQDPDGTRLDIGYGHDHDPNIAEFRLQDLGTTARVTGVVNSNNQAGPQGSYTGLSMQDDYAGIAIYIPTEINNFEEVSLKPGDEVSITGTLIEYHSLLEIQPAALSDIEVLSEHNSLPAYQIISIGEYITNSEEYESELIHFPSVQIVSGEWPLEEGSGGSIGISDGQNETVMYIDKDFDIDGNVAPFNPFSVSGLASQYDNQQIKPQGYIDLDRKSVV